MTVDVYVFVTIGPNVKIETFVKKADFDERMIQEMAYDGQHRAKLQAAGEVVELFKIWMLSEKCPSGQRYQWHSKEFEIPVHVLVGLEGGVYTGASAIFDGITIDLFDWDDAQEEFGKAKACDEFDRLTDGLVPID